MLILWHVGQRTQLRPALPNAPRRDLDSIGLTLEFLVFSDCLLNLHTPCSYPRVASHPMNWAQSIISCQDNLCEPVFEVAIDTVWVKNLAKVTGL